MDARSEKVLTLVDPALAALIRAGAATLEAKGTFLCVYQGLRTQEEQAALYAQGRTAPGHIVTDAPTAAESNHGYGMAVDVVPYLIGDCGNLNWKTNTPQFQAMVAALKEQGLEWGGDWQGDLADYDHFQMSGLPASPSKQMIDDFGQLSLPEIWAKAAAGQYAP